MDVTERPQPVGRAATHGSDVADGTDWAMRIITFPVPQAGFPVTSTSCAGSRVVLRLARVNALPARTTATATIDSATRFAFHRWSEIGARAGASGAELRQEVAPVLLHRRAQLRRTGDAAGRGERLRDLVRREVLERPLVHPVRVGAHGEHQHHVRQVDGLPPR